MICWGIFMLAVRVCLVSVFVRFSGFRRFKIVARLFSGRFARVFCGVCGGWFGFCEGRGLISVGVCVSIGLSKPN